MKRLLSLLTLLFFLSSASAQLVWVRFFVDMNSQVVDPAGVHLAGSFASGGYPTWDPAGLTMATGGGGIYELDLLLPAGEIYSYKFINGNAWGQDEGFIGGTCGNGGGDRFLDLPFGFPEGSLDLPVVCYASCDPCAAPPASVDVTFSVDMSLQNVSPSGVHLAGGFGSAGYPEWDAAGIPLTDLGGGLWEVTLTLTEGTNYLYKFINGNTFGEAEAVPVGCGVDDGFGGFNRSYTAGSTNEVIPTVCFETCAACTFVNYNITFQVDMSDEVLDPAGVHLAGSFNGWDPLANPMSAIGGGIWETVVPVQSGQTIEYKFVNGNLIGNAEIVEVGCANGNGNRSYFVTASEATLGPVCYSLCAGCPSNQVDVTFQVDMSQVATNPIGVFIVGSFQNPTPWTPGADLMTNIGGDIWSYTVALDPGTTVQYKYLNGPNWANEETVPAGCGVDNGVGGYNRSWTVGNADETIALHCFSSCNPCATPPVNVTFQVDMSNETVDPAGVHIAGSFQGWDPAATPMMDQGGGIWSATVSLQQGDIVQYKFINGNAWGQDELVPGACNVGGNRSYAVGTSDATAPLVCFGSCIACIVPQHNVSFQVDMSNEVVDPAGIHIAGSFQGWDPATTPMTDLGNGIWEITLLLDEGATYEYKYINGNAWGQDESVPAPCEVFGNRQWLVGTSDETLPLHCFASCDPCPPPPAPVNVTFRVDMSQQLADPAGVHLAGAFQGWDPSATPMTDLGNGIWEVTVLLDANTSFEYKFINGNAWGQDESIPAACAVNNNRQLTTAEIDFELPTVCFALCEGCLIDLTFQVDMFNEVVSPAGVHLAGSFQGWNPSSTPMTYLGFGIWTATVQVERFTYYEWKFLNGNAWGDDEDVPVECQTNWNRFTTTGGDSGAMPLVCFGSCSQCDGCTDPFSLEYNPFADVEDGSCATPVVWGCAYPDATNYDPSANTDDGSCLFELSNTACPGDLNDDQIINTGDLVAMLSQFGTICP